MTFYIECVTFKCKLDGYFLDYKGKRQDMEINVCYYNKCLHIMYQE